LIQKNLVLNSLELLNKREKYNIMEIGGGFGALAERLFEEDKINSLILLDIPSTLIIAFYYLSSKFGLDRVKILNSPSDVEKYYNLNDTKKILLIPTCYYNLIKNIKNINLLCNFGSFSEMDFDTIKFYLQNMPEEIKIIVSSNSNISMSDQPNEEHGVWEIISDKFPIPKYFDLVFSTIQIPFFSNWRSKTCVWFNNS
jgi:putative sugar O-methyltransferase